MHLTIKVLNFLFCKKLPFYSFLLLFACAFFSFNPLFCKEDLGGDKLSPFEKAELKKLVSLDFRNLSKVSIQGVLGYDQEYWRNPASVHVIHPDDITLYGYANTVEALRGVPGMHVSRGLSYDNFASMRNFSGFSTQKFLGKIGGREVTQLMLGSANYSVDDYPIAVIDRIEVIRGPGASIWGTNAVNGVINLVTKHSGDTQGDSVRLLVQDDGTFMGDYVHGGQVSEDSFYRVWIRDQEYAEGTLDSGRAARDDGYLRKFGFRYDKELASDLNFYIAGGGATRRLEHVLDFTNRLFYSETLTSALVPLDYARQGSLLSSFHPLYVDPSKLPTATSFWSAPDGTIPYPALLTGEISRFQRYGEMTNDSGHIVSKLDGITESELEWSLTSAFEKTDINMGHLGFEWEQNQLDLAFDANRPVGDSHRFSFGLGYRRTNLNVQSTPLEPFDFGLTPTVDLETLTLLSSSPSILEYDQDFTEFNRLTAYVQDSINLTEEIVLSVGTKFEENDLTGSGIQPGIRSSWNPNGSNVFWLGYSKAHRQPSLRERYTVLNPGRIWYPSGATALNPTFGVWANKPFAGGESLDREEIDSYEMGWRNRPHENFLLELSSYYYDSKDAVLAATSLTSVNAYEAKDAKSYGGELSIDWEVSEFWRLRGGYSLARGEVEGVREFDFPEQTASLRSLFKYSDNLTFTQSLFYADETQIPSDYNPITIPSHLRLDLGLVWRPRQDWEIGLFGRDLLESYHLETMYPGVDVEPARVERTFLLTLYKKF
ncbi:MAG: hypothetical protein CBD82_04610 [Gammaproteobacteria bacterium TMED222]|nr:MAG: hypothetical protein CBD82_04610 [Gammaproteobacteria bacterium TMED222]